MRWYEAVEARAAVRRAMERSCDARYRSATRRPATCTSGASGAPREDNWIRDFAPTPRTDPGAGADGVPSTPRGVRRERRPRGKL
jgi:hypothetical protein